MMMILFPPAVTLSPWRLLSAFCALAVPCCGQGLFLSDMARAFPGGFAGMADSEDLLTAFNRLYAELGRRLHGVLAELLAL